MTINFHLLKNLFYFPLLVFFQGAKKQIEVKIDHGAGFLRLRAMSTHGKSPV